YRIQRTQTQNTEPPIFGVNRLPDLREYAGECSIGLAQVLAKIFEGRQHRIDLFRIIPIGFRVDFVGPPRGERGYFAWTSRWLTLVGPYKLRHVRQLMPPRLCFELRPALHNQADTGKRNFGPGILARGAVRGIESP